MKKVVLALALVPALLLPAAPAGAAHEPFGRFCSFASIPDPAGPPGVQTGEIDGGPVVVADFADLVANPVHVTLKCSIQVDSEIHSALHSAPDAASASGSGVVAAVVPPTLVSYEAGPDQYVVMCTEFAVTDAHGQTTNLYYDSGSGEFSTSPDSSCWGPVCLALDCGLYGDVLHLLDYLYVEVVDPVVCPAIASLAPGVPGVVDVLPDGDVYVAGEFTWDCPPYA